jgi:hypothetical protein
LDLADRLRGERIDDPYLVWPQKFLPETWDVLQSSKLAHVAFDNVHGDMAMPPVLGLAMMSVLADACAGTRKRTVTDQQAAYTAVRESINHNTIVHADGEEPLHLIDVTLRVADLNTLPLKKLVELRRREQKTGGQSLTELRRAFVAKVDAAARDIAAAATGNDRGEIQRQFEDDMRNDFRALQQEIGELGWKVVFSREMAVGMLSSAGFLNQPVGQVIAGAAALVGMGLAYRRERRTTFAKHAMSWLYVQK